MQKLTILTLALATGCAFASPEPNPFLVNKRLPSAHTEAKPFMATGTVSAPAKAKQDKAPAATTALVKLPAVPELQRSSKLTPPVAKAPAPLLALPAEPSAANSAAIPLPPMLPAPAGVTIGSPGPVAASAAKQPVKQCKLSITGGKTWTAEANGGVILVPFVKPAGCSLALSSSVDWLTVDVDSDDHLVIRVSPADMARQGKTVLASRTHTLEVDIHQKGPAVAKPTVPQVVSAPIPTPPAAVQVSVPPPEMPPVVSPTSNAAEAIPNKPRVASEPSTQN